MPRRTTHIVSLLLSASLAAGATATTSQLAAAGDPRRATESASDGVSPWRRVGDFPSPTDAMINGVFKSPFGVVAAGGRGLGRAEIWTSLDGRAWTRIRGGPLFEQAIATDGISTPAGAIVFGGGSDPDVPVAAMWRSTDGMTWQRVDGGEAFEGGRMMDGVRGGPGYVIVGMHDIAGRSVVWTSEDGSEWERVAAQPSLELTQFVAVTRLRGTLVAVGWRIDAPPRAAAWTSTDGVTWTHAADLPGGDGALAEAVVTRDGRIVAAGIQMERGRAIAWTSTDAETWERVPLPEAAGAGIFGLAADDRRFVAVGFRSEDAGVWTSRDGRSWSVVEDDRAFSDASISSAAAFGGGFVAGGLRQELIPGTGSYELWGQVWRRPAIR